MKVIALNGSPRGEHSCTSRILHPLLEGMRSSGAKTEILNLSDFKIKQCQGCFACWIKTPGKCVMQDDMTELLDKYNAADVVCFASPIYTWNMTAALKNFVDRLVPLKSPLIVNSGGNFDLADSKPKTQQFVVISNCGFPGNNNFETMKVVVASCKPVLEIYRNCGKLLKSKDEKIKEIVNEYLQVVEQAGYEMVTQNYVSEEKKSKLEMQLMPIPDYVKYIRM